MVALCFRLVTALLALIALPAFAQTHIQPRLIAESTAPASGSTVTIALEMRTDKGWHGYWSNPGEAGFAPRLTWMLPRRASIGTPQFPVPTTLTVAGLMNYVFESDHALLLSLKVPSDLPPGADLPVRLNAEWLACTDEVCVPEKGSFALNLKIGNGILDNGATIDRYRARLPAPLGSTATFARNDGQLRLSVPFPAGAALAEPHFFPLASGLLADAAPQRFTRAGDTLIVALSAPQTTAVPVAGVLSLGNGRGVSIAASPGVVPADGTPLQTADGTGNLAAILLAIGGSVLGGLLLNVMPCVFPILSLKALSLAKAGVDEGAARRDALAYAAGAIAVCLALGGAILALRAGGSAIGWAFQLQDPRVIVVLLLLVVGIAFNLAGLFELPSIGGGIATGGNGFLTGALAAFIATPCTGPFMGAALGAALVLPVAAALGVFAGLGIGLALPFLLLAFVPALRRRLPKPGAWMEALRRVLSVPMFVTALGLAWLLGRQAGADAVVTGLAAALLAALGLWWAGSRQRAGRFAFPIATAALVVAAVAGILAMPVPCANATAGSVDALASQPFSQSRLDALRKGNRPVFVFFTADWCLTCKVNERVAIDRTEVANAFSKANVVTLVGDWTRGDPAISRFLASQGRSGVPLYLYYRPAAAEPEILPQVLTVDTLTALTRTR